MVLICVPPHPSRLFAVPPSPRGEGFCHGECGYYMVVDCTTNTGYDGTNEAYTGGASYDGTGSQRGSVAEPDGEGREGIKEFQNYYAALETAAERKLAKALWENGTVLKEVKYYVDF